MQNKNVQNSGGLNKLISQNSKVFFNKYVDIIVVLLGISFLSVWGAFARIGRTEDNLCVKSDEITAEWYASTIIMVGALFGLYGALKPHIEDRKGEKNTPAFGILFVMHILTLFVVWYVYWHIIDHARDSTALAQNSTLQEVKDAACDEFVGQQHMLFNVAFIGITISALYVFYALSETVTNEKLMWLKGIGHGLVYGAITFVFFFYAAADSVDSTSFWDDGERLWLTLVPTIVVFGYNVVTVMRDFSINSYITKGTNNVLINNRIVKLYAGVALLVVAINIGLSTSILMNDIDNLAHNGTDGTGPENDVHGNADNSTSGCLGDDHDDVLGMGITVVGYWTMYILLLSMAFIQYSVQLAAQDDEVPACAYDIGGAFTLAYRDTFAGLNMPTVLITATWVWLLAGGLMHHSKIADDKCGNNDHFELGIMISHTIGFVAVAIVFPLYSSNFVRNLRQINPRQSGEYNKDTEFTITDGPVLVPMEDTKLRPSNRFTTRARVAVDVNTPLNFA